MEDMTAILAAVTQGIPMAITVWELPTPESPPGSIVLRWANQRAEANAGTTLAPYVGMAADDIPSGMVPCAPGLEFALASVANGGEYDIGAVSLRGRVYRTYMTLVRPLVVAAVFEDCTEEYLAFVRLNKKADDLRKSNEDLEHYAYVTSHDLQEPLRIIRNYVGLLAEDFGETLSGDALIYMKFIEEHAERGQQLIDALLKYSRVGRDASRVSIEASDVLQQVMVLYHDVLAKRGVTLTADPLPRITADPILFRQALQNLIGNAIKFRSDTRSGLIHVSYVETPTHWVFHVRDNGIGFDMRHAKDVMLLFRRMHSLDKSGTGIGLAICKRIADWHGGNCWLESVPDAGTSAFISIAKEAP